MSTNQPTGQTPTSAEPGSATRRRHRRPAAARPAAHAEPATTDQPTAQAAAQAAPTVAEPAVRQAPRPAPRPSQPEAPKDTTQEPTAPAGERAKAPARRGGRRPTRARAPQLVPPPRPEGESAAMPPTSAEITEAPHDSPQPAPALAPTPRHATPPARAGRTVPVYSETHAPDAIPNGAEATAPAYEAVIETLTPAEVSRALASAAAPAPEADTAPPARRYRFDSRTRATPIPARRPERIGGAVAPASTSPDMPAPATDHAPTAPAAESAAAPPLTGAAGPAFAPEGAATPDWSTLATLGAAIGETALAPDATPAVANNGAASSEAIPDAAAPAAALPGVEAPPAGAVGADSEETEAGDEAAGTRKRRRGRRRGNGTSTATGAGVRHLDAVIPPEQLELETPSPVPQPSPRSTPRTGTRPSTHNGEHAAERTGERDGELEPYPLYGAGAPTSQKERGRPDGYGSPEQPYEMYAPYQQDPWTIAQAQQQIGQPRSPFGAPEPNTPRGFGPQPRGVAGPATGRTVRTPGAPTSTASQLGASLTQAIQQQTDRLLTEMRHTQAPPSMTVMFPPLPSTERVGVFVDVANLLYSSRSLRVALDFGRMLEFLRGNRRLVRAHAYAPTNPEPRAEQQFLSVVQGVGYRITTKNYKTFSSGAKKADLDLDMCMDIVRLVDAKAVDTIVLVSGDSDFLPLLEYCSDHGVRVEVAAFDDAAAAILRQSCDLFINLSLVDDIRG